MGINGRHIDMPPIFLVNKTNKGQRKQSGNGMICPTRFTLLYGQPKGWEYESKQR